jgi:tripartite-type tricarboxylate transporter receptor subunit TctC
MATIASRFLLAAVLGAGVLAAHAAAPNYPTRPIRILVPFPPGGGTDIVARVLGQHLGSTFNQSVVVDNRPGGNTVIATDLAAQATPDGHTLLVQINNLTVLPALTPPGKKALVNLDQLAPISLIGALPHLLVVPKRVPANNLRELIAMAKAAPKKMTYASAGIGTPVHLAGALFAHMANVDVVHVPYKGAAGYSTAVLGAEVDMTFGSAPSMLPHVKTGVLKALAVTTAKRVKTIPDVPTLDESGLKGYDIVSWYGLLTTAGTPAPIINLLHSEVVRALGIKAVTDKMTDFELIGNTPAEFSAFLKKDAAISAKLIQQSGATAD